MEIVSFKAEARKELGSRGSKLIRREGKIPCVIYGNGDPEYLVATKNQVKSLVYTPEFKIAEIELDGKTNKCLLKDIQMHPVTDEILHIDFLRLQDGVKVKVDIPVGFKGVSPGVKSGGKLIQNLRKIKVKVDPQHLVNKLFVSIEGVELGQSVRVKYVEVTDEMEVLSVLVTPVAQVAVPRALKSATAEAEGEEGIEGGEEAAVVAED